MSKKNVEKYRLLVVAHPDDETLFFSAAVLQQRELPWTVICVTDGNADGQGSHRALQFKQACKKLKVSKSLHWDFPDIYEKRLDSQRLMEKLQALPKPTEVYTHGATGEYGHPHHQDVSFAVHSVFAKKTPVWAPAYNCQSEKIFRLSQDQYKIKSKIYSEIYKGETLRFAEFIPNRNVDEFARVGLPEVEEIYQCLLTSREPQKSKLKKYKWFHGFLQDKVKQASKRPF
jgi:LmbE family N-acetylglucosaminyl deacetylase